MNYQICKIVLNISAAGCQVGDQVYGDRATWIDRREDVIIVSECQKSI